MPNSNDRQTAIDRESYRSTHTFMMENHKKRRLCGGEIRGKNLTPVCPLTGGQPSSRLLAIQGDATDPSRPERKAVVPPSIFEDGSVAPGQFGDVWKERTRPALSSTVGLLKQLFTGISEESPSIAIALVLDHDVLPSTNLGKCRVSELPSRLKPDAKGWIGFIKHIRTDHAFREVVASLSSRLFGMRLTFHDVPLVPYELYTWKWPFTFSVQAIAPGATMPTMCFVPESLVVLA